MSLSPDPISEVKNIVLMVVFSILMGLIGYLGYAKSLLQTQVAQQKTDITALTDQNTNFKTQVDATNATIQKMHDDVPLRPLPSVWPPRPRLAMIAPQQSRS